MATSATTAKADLIPHGNWRVAPGASRIDFRMRLLGVIPTKGSFRAFTGRLEADPSQVTTGELVIQVASIETGNPKRDNHLCSKDFFEVEKYPRAQFDLISVKAVEDRAAIVGTLRIRDREIAIDAPATITQGSEGSLRIEASMKLDPRKAGFSYVYVPRSMRVQIDLSLDRVS
jgi:polyisoprenoid-binding protein YceI